MVATSPETRSVASFTSDSSTAADSVLATHSRPGSSVSPSSICPARSHQSMSAPAAARAGAMSHTAATLCLSSQSARAASRSATASALAAARHVPGLVGPGAEPTSPDSGPAHHPGNRFLPPGAAQQFHPPLDQDPPEVGGLALPEEHVAASEVDLVAGRDQVVELLVAK